MCGIAGIMIPGGSITQDALQHACLRMGASLRHRGPDDNGIWIDPSGTVGLAHARLAVVDLSPLGHQPMLSGSGRWVIVYNGEIYNFRALRRELEGHGHAFRGRSDTEVILASVDQWGVEDSLRRFNGMFAVVLWDQQERTLYMARDRFGEKPLYYGWVGKALVFASELKAIRLHPQFDKPIDIDSLASYMRLGYVPAPRSIYEDISKLPPGTFLQMRASSTRPQSSPQAFWSLVEVATRSMQSEFRGTDDEAIEEFDELLSNAVRLRLEADVPLGAFLSGGVDSSGIVAMMQRHASQSVRTFTIGFAEDQY